MFRFLGVIMEEKLAFKTAKFVGDNSAEFVNPSRRGAQNIFSNTLTMHTLIIHAYIMHILITHTLIMHKVHRAKPF